MSQSGPRYLALADAIDRDIRAGRLAPGERLPPHRDLSDALGMAVGTVTRAYAEAERRGLVRGEVGRGTFVNPGTPSGLADPFFHEPSGPGVIDLGLNYPLPFLDPDLNTALADMAAGPSLGHLMQYGPSEGLPQHREAGAAWLARFGMHVDPDRVVCCAGAQHALTVLLMTLFKPGDRIVTEPVTYPELKALASRFRLRLIPAAMDKDGIVPESVAEICRREPVRGLCVIPSMHNPTTARLSVPRRERLAEIAEEFRLQIVEDDPYAALLSAPPPPLAHFAPERTHFAASTSKALCGGLRVAFLAVPPASQKRVARTVSATLWMAPPLSVEVVARWIMDGTAEKVIAAKRVESRRRHELALDALAGCAFNASPESYFLWLKLPEPWRGDDFARSAEERGVRVIPAERFLVGRAVPPWAVRVSLSVEPDTNRLRQGLQTLADILRGR